MSRGLLLLVLLAAGLRPGLSVGHLEGHVVLRLGHRERLEGADLVVFDPARVTDRATWEDPRRPTEGIRWVIVAGQPVAENGRLTGAAPGRVLRSPRKRGTRFLLRATSAKYQQNKNKP